MALATLSSRPATVGLLLAWFGAVAPVRGSDVLAPVSDRYAVSSAAEVPDFQRHVVPLLGRLGCNGRTCHGSFQGQGGFRLSLFGYDLAADHEALAGGPAPRINMTSPAESLMLYKPTHGDEHGGGERMTPDRWPYHLLQRWIAAGAGGAEANAAELMDLEVTPAEIVFSAAGERCGLRVLAHWSDGSVEDVTPLCRYQSNDESIAEVDVDGVVSSKGRGDTHVIAYYDSGIAVAPVLRPVSPRVGPDYPEVPTPTRIDQLVTAKLRKLGIVPAEICSDAEFLRRVSLDLTGTLPIPSEIDAFLADASPDKRTRKIDELLQRPTYTARWTTKLCDITGNSPRHFEDNAPPQEYAQNWYRWIAQRVQANVPYDELMAGIVLGTSRQSPGQEYRDYARQESAFYRATDPADFAARQTMPYYWAKRSIRSPEERAQNFSHVFLGVRIECAQCHKHPFDRWTQADYRGFTALFERIGYGVAPDARQTYQAMLDQLDDDGNQAQRVRARLIRAQQGQVVPWLEVFLAPVGTRVEKGRVVDAPAPAAPRVLGGPEIRQQPDDDPRRPLTEWLRSPQNPYFARVFINRVWAEYFGTGIINPPDDMNLSNPPSNAALLDYLAEAFIERGFDMKWLHREIANSHTYQRSSKTNDTNRLDTQNFSHCSVRRLPAAVFLDAVAQATANSVELAAAATSVEQRAIGPKGGAFVGRYEHGDYAAKVFGRSPRDTNCDCSASDEPNLLQAVYLQNDKEVLAAIEGSGRWLGEIRASLKASRGAAPLDTGPIVREAFLRTVSRPPTAAEARRSADYLAQAHEPAEALEDLLWALLNTREFVTNH